MVDIISGETYDDDQMAIGDFQCDDCGVDVEIEFDEADFAFKGTCQECKTVYVFRPTEWTCKAHVIKVVTPTL
jgi:DNA replicative helicase MCM subunit Mcm2 (Cdc46/Mcm family)